MTPLLLKYSQTLVAMYLARDSGRSEEEDMLLSRLDFIWLDMTEDERSDVDSIALEVRHMYQKQRRVTQAFSSFGSLLHKPSASLGIPCGGFGVHRNGWTNMQMANV